MLSDDENVHRIVSGLAEVLAIAERGAEAAQVDPAEDLDVRAIRSDFKLSRDVFAARFGFPLSAVRDGEQRRRRPEAGAVERALAGR